MTSTAHQPTRSQWYLRPVVEWIWAGGFSVVIALGVAELALRFQLIPVPVTYETFLFASQPSNFRSQDAEFGYRPFSTNREVLVQVDLNTAWIEYDVTFHVNNAGLVQERDIQPDSPYTILVGDSFAHGLGASPWFYDLELNYPHLSLANLGILGSGVVHWVKAVNWFERVVARVDRVIVLFITDDFFRPDWQAHTTSDEIALCYESRCWKALTAYRDGNLEALVEQRRRLALRDASAGERMKEWVKSILQEFRLGQFAINYRRSLLPIDMGEEQFGEMNRTAFTKLAMQYPVPFALHLPQREEVAAGHWSRKSLALGAFVEQTGVRYVDGLSLCGLTIDDFHRVDVHPNAAGYKRIRVCVSELLHMKNSTE